MLGERAREVTDVHWVCIDASVALAAVLPADEQHPAALRLIGSLIPDRMGLCAPALFGYECNAVLRRNVFRGTLTTEEAQEAAKLISVMGVEQEYDPRDSVRAFEIASEYKQPRTYDAAYAAHAEARRIRLVTADRSFFEAVNGPKMAKSAARLSYVELLT